MLILNFSIIKRILEQQLPKINQNRKMLMFLKKTNWTQLAKNISTMKYIEHVPWSEYWYLEGLQKYREGEWGFFSITCLVNAKTNDKELQGTVDITRCLDTVVEHYVTNVQLIWNFMCESTTCQVF